MTNTRKMVTIAILSAVAYLLMYFQFPLFTDFLQVDFSIVPVLIGLVIFDVKSAFLILIIRSVLKLLFNGNPGSLIGMPLSIVAVGVFILVFAFVWKKQQTFKNYILASILSTVGLVISMVALNYFYALPLYMAVFNMSAADFGGIGYYMLYAVIPFNIVEGILFSVAFFLVYRTAGPIIKKV